MKRLTAFLLLTLLVLLLWPAASGRAQAVQDAAGPSPALPSAPGPAAPQGAVPEWQARLELGRMLLWDKQYDAALAEFKKIMAERPDALEARVGSYNFV